eukprot:345639-Lingulodinium_polyedra.AAC.1
MCSARPRYLPKLYKFFSVQDDPKCPAKVRPKAQSLFMWTDPNYFRRSVLTPVSGAKSNDVRAQVELQLKAKAADHHIHKSLAQYHVGHSTK